MQVNISAVRGNTTSQGLQLLLSNSQTFKQFSRWSICPLLVFLRLRMTVTGTLHCLLALLPSSLLRGGLSQVLSWTSLCQALFVVGTALGAVVTVWTVKLLARHAWYTHRLSCFSKPPTHSWLIGHLGQVRYTDTHNVHPNMCKWSYFSVPIAMKATFSVFGISVYGETKKVWNVTAVSQDVLCCKTPSSFRSVSHKMQGFKQSVSLPVSTSSSDAEHRGRSTSGGWLGADAQTLLQLVPRPVLSLGPTLPPRLRQTSANGSW